MQRTYRFEDVQVDPAERTLHVAGKPASIGGRAFDLMLALMARAGELVSKDDLLVAVWGPLIVEEANLHVHVSALRKVLGADAIETVPGRGYRLLLSPVPDAAAAGSARGADVETPGDLPVASRIDATPGNLVLAPPTLYGRTDEVAAVRALLRTNRLVTLLGICGVGKTSLALAVAHAEQPRWPAGVWFVDMAPVMDPDQVVGAIAHALGVSLATHRPALHELATTLGARRMLVVVDNAEHLCDAISAAVGGLLDKTSQLHLLVTSRQALRLTQEQRFPLAGLSAPAHLDLSEPGHLGAVTLFAARATALSPRFRLTSANAPAVAEICRRLDGLPLAIELAAARVPVLGLEELRVRLHRSLSVLGGKATVAAPRHQTLRATFDWTHDLLSPDEQLLLRRLAMFVGGFSLKLAEDVISGHDAEPDGAAPRRRREASGMLDDLSALIERSLIVVSETDPPRYRLLEVTRAYALEKLVDAGELEWLSRRHALAIWRLFAAAEAELNEQTRGALGRGQFLERLAPELDNLRAARAWCEAAADHVLSVGLAAASAEALRLLGRATEALQALLNLRDRLDDGMPDESLELFWTSLCALGTHGRLSRAEMMGVIARSEALYLRLGRARRTHVGLYRKGFALLHLGDVDKARQAIDEMLALEAADWPARAIAQRLTLLGAVEAVQSRFEVSVAAYREAAALLDGDPGESDVVLNVLSNLCMSLLGAERDEEALAVANDVLARRPSPVVRNITWRVTLAASTFLARLDEARRIAIEAMPGWLADDMLPHMLSVFAWLAFLQGRVADALRLDVAARTETARRGLSNTPVFNRARTNLERAIADAALPPHDCARWRTEGERLDQDEIVALCLGDPVACLPGSSSDKPTSLPSRHNHAS